MEDIFLPFPNNTIQFGLYKPVTFDDNEYLNHYVQELSNIIINGLGEDSVDAEIMITFAFYLHLGLLKINLQYSELNIFFDDFKTKFNENNSNLSLRILFERYEENETMLEEIYQDIIKKSDIDLPWLAKWISLCESFKQNHSHLSIIDIHKRQVHLINKYLGLPRNMEKILYHFLIKILESKLIDETREMDKLV